MNKIIAILGDLYSLTYLTMNLVFFKRSLATFVILFWFLLGSYTGAAGLIYEEHERKELDIEQIEKLRESEGKKEKKVRLNNISFKNHERAELYLEEINTNRIFGWIIQAPSFLILVISSCGLGAFGGLINIVSTIAFKGIPLEKTQYFVLPFLGFILGIVVLAISYLLPAILVTENDLQIRQTTLMCFSLFTGLFSHSFLIWLESRFGTYLKSKNQ